MAKNKHKKPAPQVPARNESSAILRARYAAQSHIYLEQTRSLRGGFSLFCLASIGLLILLVLLVDVHPPSYVMVLICLAGFAVAVVSSFTLWQVADGRSQASQALLKLDQELGAYGDACQPLQLGTHAGRLQVCLTIAPVLVAMAWLIGFGATLRG